MKKIEMNSEAFCRALVTSASQPVPSADLEGVLWGVVGPVGEQPTFGIDTTWGGDRALVRVYPIRTGPGTLTFRCKGAGGEIGFDEVVEVVPALVPDDVQPEWGDTPPAA